MDFSGFSLYVLQAKLNMVKKALLDWSKRAFGNIFIKKTTLEDIIQVKEAQFQINLTPENRAELHKVEADLNRFLRLEEEFLEADI